MLSEALINIFIPFVGTLVGALCVFFAKGASDAFCRAVRGFSAGVMVAAAVWSLLIPSIELSDGEGALAVLPAVLGFVLGTAFFLLCDKFLLGKRSSPVPQSALPVLAVALHNFPEGMAVGAICAEMLVTNDPSVCAAATALSIGIAVQNLPEGAIVSVPLHADGKSKLSSFLLGALSGAVEPLGALLTLLASGIAIPLLPYMLSFAAGAMFYAFLEDRRSWEADQSSHSLFVLFFSLGLSLMMSLDVLLS